MHAGRIWWWKVMLTESTTWIIWSECHIYLYSSWEKWSLEEQLVWEMKKLNNTCLMHSFDCLIWNYIQCMRSAESEVVTPWVRVFSNEYTCSNAPWPKKRNNTSVHGLVSQRYMLNQANWQASGHKWALCYFRRKGRYLRNFFGDKHMQSRERYHAQWTSRALEFSLG